MEHKTNWLKIEENRRQNLVILPDNPEEDEKINYPLKIGGADLSFIPDDVTKAVACYAIIEYRDESQKSAKVIYKDFKIVSLGKIDYIFQNLSIQCQIFIEQEKTDGIL